MQTLNIWWYHTLRDAVQLSTPTGCNKNILSMFQCVLGSNYLSELFCQWVNIYWMSAAHCCIHWLYTHKELYRKWSLCTHSSALPMSLYITMAIYSQSPSQSYANVTKIFSHAHTALKNSLANEVQLLGLYSLFPLTHWIEVSSHRNICMEVVSYEQNNELKKKKKREFFFFLINRACSVEDIPEGVFFSSWPGQR